MKTFTNVKRSITKWMLFVIVVSNAANAKASGGELKFENSTIHSGTAGANGTIYRFPQVNNHLDALVKIVGRSSSLVTLTSIDLTNTGWQKAWQPQIAYNGGVVTGAHDWWMEFEFTFVQKGTSTPGSINKFDLTALDIDGNNSNLREWNSFYGATSYTLEGASQLSVSNLLGTILNLLSPGKKFVGALTNYAGIDTSITSIMTTIKYTNVNKFTMRVGGSTTSSTSDADRMSSIWFKSFDYDAPLTLPVSLSSFTATLNGSKTDLKWSTSTEINLSHFVVERSFDGKIFTDAGTVSAAGNSNYNNSYSFADPVDLNRAGVIYYRLRSSDLDGKQQYSETRLIRVGKMTDKTVSILTYPNPVMSELRITVPAAWQNKKVVYELFNANGSAVRRSVSASAGQTETMNLSQVSPGLYFVIVSCDGETAKQKIVKQ